MINSSLMQLLVIGHVMGIQQKETMFSGYPEKRVGPAPFEALDPSNYSSPPESERRNQAAIDKRNRRAEKLRKLNPPQGATS